MAKKGQEFEPDVTHDDDDDEDDDDDDDDDGALVKAEGGEGLSGKKRKRMGGRQRLTRERVVSIHCSLVVPLFAQRGDFNTNNITNS